MINTDKAYLLGLLVGGGIIHNDTLQVVLPYKNWGDLEINPSRAGNIAHDILSRMQPRWKTSYNIDVSYKTGTDWKVLSNKISAELIEDLQKTGLPREGELRSNANLKELLPYLNSNEHKKAFVTGLVDTIGSMSASHRRFTENFQIISLEFKGSNFVLVTDIVKILNDLECSPDQVLWNHPNQHSSNDRYYHSWKKGFKVRVCLDDYFLKGGFFSLAKKRSAEENRKKQHATQTAKNKNYVISGRVALHIDENSDWLPPYMRGGHFVHNLHYAKFLGIPTPPSFDMGTVLANFQQYFCPFTCMTKGSIGEITQIVEKEDYLSKTKYQKLSISPAALLKGFQNNPTSLIAGNSEKDGFPSALVMQSITYVINATIGKNIKGKRVLGNYHEVIQEHLSSKTGLDKLGIKIYKPNVGTCLLVKNNSYAALVGYVNDIFNKTLITEKNGYKVNIRNPIFDECIEL